MGFLHVLLWCSKTYSFIKTFIQFWENFYLKKFIQLLYNIICEIMFFCCGLFSVKIRDFKQNSYRPA